MKLYVLFMLLMGTLAKERTSEVDKFCREATNVSDEDFKPFFTDPEYEPPQVLKCFFKCLMQRLGVMENGEFKGAQVPADQPNIIKFMDTCAIIQGVDDCDTAYLIVKCIKDFLLELIGDNSE